MKISVIIPVYSVKKQFLDKIVLPTVEAVLAVMLKKGLIEKIGVARNTNYITK